jgi:hypothetical protein
MTRLFAFGLAIALALSTTAASPHERRPSPDGGCLPYYYRGAGGNCVYYGAERPDGYYGYSYRQPYRPYKYSQP